MQEKQYLVVIGVPSIKKFVFGTNRLKEIRGASALLDHINTDETRDFLRNKAGIPETDIIFLGGGAGQFILSVSEIDLERYLCDLERIYSERAKGGIRLLWGWAEYSGDNYRQARRAAESMSEEKRDELPFISCTQMHTGFVRECGSCSCIAVSLVGIDEELEPLCDVCIEKLRFEREIKRKRSEEGAWNGFLRYLKEWKGVQTQRPGDFETIGELCAAKRGYTAVVYADGNAMGKLIKEIDDRETYRRFSETVDGAVKQACYEALYDVFFQKEEPQILPADILLLGGDDLVVYLTAESALPFAVRAASKFNEITKQRFGASEYGFLKEKIGEKGLTLSVGIAYGKSHTPFSILLDQAEELLKSAKEGGSQDESSGPYFSPAYIDFHISTSFNQINVADCRLNHLELSSKGKRKIRLYQKPYSLEDAEALLNHAQDLKNSGIPSTRLKRLGSAPALGKVNGSLECMKLYTRMPMEKRRAIWQALDRFGCNEIMPWDKKHHERDPRLPRMPWNEKHDEYDSTVLVDLMEIAAFCGTHDGVSHET